MRTYKGQEQDSEGSEAQFVEVDPSGRYGRYKEVLGKGAFKKVYRAFDGLEGIEVAWNQVKLTDVLYRHEDLESLYSEVHLLKTLKHKSIIKLYCSWVDIQRVNINFITELFTSGTLRQYRKKHKHVDLRALKKWSRQILEGLTYLHGQIPPVIHRDLKCDNIFVNGNQGEVKIGDLGLAAILHQASSAHSIIGTPEFMAPEFYDEEYNELVDVYAFGMCLLELVTLEYPYNECSNAAQIYKKVTLELFMMCPYILQGIKPAALAKVTDPGLRAFIEKCISKASDRLPAKDLLNHSFLRSSGELENVSYPSPTGYLNRDFPGERCPSEGQAEDLNTIFVNLRIADSKGNFRLIHFPFDIQLDTALSVASEMVEELDVMDQDVAAIAGMIDSEIRSHNLERAPVSPVAENRVHVIGNFPVAETKDVGCLVKNDSAASANITLRRMPSGRIYWSSSLNTLNDDFLVQQAPSGQSSEIDLTTSGTEGCTQYPDGKKSIGTSMNSFLLMQRKHGCACNGSGGVDERTDSAVAARTLKKDVKPDEDEALVRKKLECLLAKQQEELDELRRKQEADISNLLEGVMPDVRQRVLATSQKKVTERAFHEGCEPQKEAPGSNGPEAVISL